MLHLQALRALRRSSGYHGRGERAKRAATPGELRAATPGELRAATPGELRAGAVR
jgi:hypothetical protein